MVEFFCVIDMFFKRIVIILVVFTLPFNLSCERSVKKGASESLKCELSAELFDEFISGWVSYGEISHLISDNKLTFNLYPNKIYGISQAISVGEVLVDGEQAHFDFEGKNSEYLIVNCPSNSPNTVKIFFKTQILEGEGRLAKFEDGYNLAYFYPHPCAVDERSTPKKYDYTSFGDPFFDIFCDYSVQITIPSQMALACGFNPVYCDPMGEKTCYGYQQKMAKTFAFCASKNYSIVSKKWGNKRVNYYFINDLQAEERLELIIDVLSFLNERIGSYAYENFTVCQTVFNAGGMEYPAFCTVNKNLSDSDYDYALIHETAHQYFPICIDFNQCETPVLDEGLTEFLSMAFLKEYNREAHSKKLLLMRAGVNAYLKAVESGKVAFKSSSMRALNEFSGEYEYVCAVYKRGYVLFEELAQKLGERDFFNRLNGFYTKFYGKNPTKKDFFKSFSSLKVKAEQIFS